MERFKFEKTRKYRLEHEPRELIEKFTTDIFEYINAVCKSPHAGSIVEVREISEKNERLTYFVWHDIFLASVLDRRRELNHGEYNFQVQWAAFKDVKAHFLEVIGPR